LQQVKASAFSILSLIPSFWSSAASSRASYLPSSSPLSFFLNRPQKHNSYDITPKTQFFLHFSLFSSQLPAPPPQKGTKGLSLQTKLQKYNSFLNGQCNSPPSLSFGVLHALAARKADGRAPTLRPPFFSLSSALLTQFGGGWNDNIYWRGNGGNEGREEKKENK
jgi:hypothetical protein